MSGSDGDSASAPRASRREIFGWCMFDFANSSYTTIIISVVFNRYFIRRVVGDGGEFLWGLSIFVSMVLVLVSAPVVGAIADFSAAKKRFLFITYAGCVVTTALLYFAVEGAVVFAMTFFILSNFFFSSGENIVAAFLPDIATRENMGSVSGYGWALGYFGGLGSLLVCLPLAGDNARWCFPVTAVFFLLAGIPTFAMLRQRGRRQELPAGETYVTVGFRRVWRTLREVRRFRQLFRFLIVFLFFSSGVMIVVAFASDYAEAVIGMTGEEIFIFFIVVQLSAALGAFLFGLLQDRIGAKRTILITLVIWLVVSLAAFFARSAAVFYAIGNLAGLAMGATQSGSRALVGTFSPTERSAEFFGFWGLPWKLSSGVGVLLFGAVAAENYRLAILCTAGLFAVGLFGMLFVDEDEGKRAAGADQPAPRDAE